MEAKKSLRQRALEAQDRRLDPVEAKEWGFESGELFGGVMSGTDRDSFDTEGAALRAAEPESKLAGSRNFRARALVRSLFDAQGQRVFSDADATSLGMKSSVVLDRLYDAIGPKNGLMAEDVEKLAGKSASSGPSGAPGSGTPSPTESPSPSSSAS